MARKSRDEIQHDYHDAVAAAVADHESGVRNENKRLASDLAAAGNDPLAKAEILADFERKIGPVRDAYHADVEKAVRARDQALSKIEGSD